MMNSVFSISVRRLSSGASSAHYRLLVAGGGCGGSAIANKFASKLGAGKVGVIEPNTMHYYQPLWTLVGAGIKTLEQSVSPTAAVLPKQATWIRDRVASIEAERNTVRLASGGSLTYDFLVVAMGIELNFEAIRGFPAAWADPRICSNYSAETVTRTFKAFEAFRGGAALFTLPNSPLKCPGAPQKIAYLFDDYLRRHRRRDAATLAYCTALPAVFGVAHYAAVLREICAARGIEVRTRRDLVEVRPQSSVAVFRDLDTGEQEEEEYALLHVAPPCRPWAALRLHSPELVDDSGFVAVDRETLQHSRFPNVFGIGDNCNVPTAKTAAAIASQSGVVGKNLAAVMAGDDPRQKVYDGYTSCPLVTGYSSCVLAEFDYSMQPLETLPIDQAKERYLSYLMKAHLLPSMYWRGLVKGMWNGPALVRKMLHLGMGK